MKSHTAKLLVLGLVIAFAFLLQQCVMPARAAEPTLVEVLSHCGYNNIALSTTETWPAGTYEIVLLAEFAGYHATNELYYYPVNTNNFILVFSGPEGGFGYVSPPITKTFNCGHTFGLSMNVSNENHRYFTQTARNPDGLVHSKVYRNLDQPSMYLIGFENLYGSSADRDYQDMVVSLRPIKQYLTVKTDPVGITTILGEGWYDYCTYAALTAPSTVDVSTGIRYGFSYWDVDTVSKGMGNNPISVCMDANHTATAHYIFQYLLTVTSSYGTPGGAGWYDSGVNAYATLNTGSVDHGNGTRHVFTSWNGDASGTNYVQSNAILMNGPKTAVANWKTQYYLTLTTNPGGITTPSGGGWYDTGTYASISTMEYIDIIPGSTGSSRYKFTGWNTADMSEITDPSSPSTTVLVDKPKTVTANYKTQYAVTFTHSGLDSTSTGTVVTVDGNPKTYSDLSYLFWADSNTVITYSYSNVSSTTTGKRFTLISVTGPTSPITVTKSETVVGNYKIQYQITFAQSGVGSDFLGTVVTIDGNDYSVSGLSKLFWWDSDTSHSFSFKSPLVVTSNAKRYLWKSTTGLSTLQVSSITATTSGSVTGNYNTQYYLTVTSPYDSPTPTTGWFDTGTSITASVTSPWAGPTGTRYVCTGWTGTGSVPSSGPSASVTFTINTPSSITWNWKTQYYLTVRTDPSGIATILGEGWYDVSTTVPLTAPDVSGYGFIEWKVDNLSKGSGVKSISVNMDASHIAIAKYNPEGGAIVGGSTFSIKSPQIHTWLSLNIVIIAAFIAAGWMKRRRRNR